MQEKLEKDYSIMSSLATFLYSLRYLAVRKEGNWLPFFLVYSSTARKHKLYNIFVQYVQMIFSFLFRKKIVAFHANVHTIWGYWHIISETFRKKIEKEKRQTYRMDGQVCLKFGVNNPLFIHKIVFSLVYDQNHCFGLGPIPKLKLAATFGYCNQYRNYISKRESSYRYWNNLALVRGIFSS